MSADGDMLRPVSARSRNTRSHSLKPQSQPMVLFKQRSKRTMSLPSKPVLLPLINIQRCHDNWDGETDEDEIELDTNGEDMGMKMSSVLALVLVVKHMEFFSVSHTTPSHRLASSYLDFVSFLSYLHPCCLFIRLASSKN